MREKFNKAVSRNSKSTHLDKCPFCGGEPGITPTIEHVEHDSWVASINCDTCDISLTPQYTAPSQGEAVSEAIAAWNKRAAMAREKS